MKVVKVLTILIAFFLLAMASPVIAQVSSVMKNDLYWTGEGNLNPSYGTQVKNIIIFHAGGWAGLPTADYRYAPTWPLSPPALVGGAVGYLSKSNASYLEQLHLIKSLGSVAIAVLIMPDEEAGASGYGACFNGMWVSNRNCSGGAWTSPSSLFPHIRWAAWMQGVESAPMFSINLYDKLGDSNRAQLVVERLRAFVDWYMPLVGAASLRTIDGRVVVLTEGLPENTNLCDDQRANAELAAYMSSRTDIFWLDNLLCSDSNPPTAGNIYRSATVADSDGKIQEWLKSVWGSRYRWTFLDRYGHTPSETVIIPEDIRLRWLNVSPHEPDMYPVVVSGWNEYGEYLVFEPSEDAGWAEYYYLQWRLSQQP